MFGSAFKYWGWIFQGWNFQVWNVPEIILKLKKSLTFNNDVGPACLPDPSFAPEKTGELAIVSGWGTAMEGKSKLLFFYLNHTQSKDFQAFWVGLLKNLTSAEFFVFVHGIKPLSTIDSYSNNFDS